MHTRVVVAEIELDIVEASTRVESFHATADPERLRRHRDPGDHADQGPVGPVGLDAHVGPHQFRMRSDRPVDAGLGGAQPRHDSIQLVPAVDDTNSARDRKRLLRQLRQIDQLRLGEHARHLGQVGSRNGQAQARLQ